MEDRVRYGKPSLIGSGNQSSAGQDQDRGVIGIDFGATQLRAAVVTRHGIGPIERTATPNQGSADDVWQSLSDLIQTVLDRNKGYRPLAICAGVPSVVDTSNGTVYDVQHIPACKELALGKLITERFGVMALINNDANAFALGEYYYGKGGSKNIATDTDSNGAVDQVLPTNGKPGDQRPGRSSIKGYKKYRAARSSHESGHPDNFPEKSSGPNQDPRASSAGRGSLVGLTIGTGLGAGLILNGKLYSGPNCGAGEIGCLPYLDGNLERYVSGTFFNKDGRTGQTFYKMARAGDPGALELYQRFGHHLGQAVKITMYTYDPDRIVLGGTVSQAFDLFEAPMLAAMQDFDFPGMLQKIQVYPSSLENGAILGAAALYFDHVR